MAGAPSACELLAAAARAQARGVCAGLAAGAPGERALCQFPEAANAALRLQAPAWARAWETPVPGAPDAARLAAFVAAADAGIAAAAGAAAPLRWDALPACGLGRLDALRLGMRPAYPLGGNLLLGAVGWDAPWVPLWADRYVNPTLATAAMAVALLLAVLVLRALLIALRVGGAKSGAAGRAPDSAPEGSEPGVSR